MAEVYHKKYDNSLSDFLKICADSIFSLYRARFLLFQILALQNRKVHTAFVVSVFEKIIAQSTFVGKTAFFDYASRSLVYRAFAYLHFMKPNLFKTKY